MQKKIDAGLVVFRDDHTEPPFRKAHLKPIPDELDMDEPESEDEDDEDGETVLAQQVRGTYFYKQSQPSVKRLRAIFGGKKVFPNPKDAEEISKLISYVMGTCQSGLVLDFFGGSGTTGDAVLSLNQESGSSHRFVVVQIPELVNAKKREGKASLELGFPTISSLTIERVKRVINGYGDNPSPIPDAGFKVYRLQKSNFPRCEFRPDPSLDEAENVAALRHYIEEKEAAHLAFLDDSQEQAVFDEVLLKNGFQLTYTRTRRDDFPDNTVYEISDGHRSGYASLAWSEQIQDSTIKRLRELDEAGEEPFFLCLERSLDTTRKWNLNHLLGKRFTAF